MVNMKNMKTKRPSRKLDQKRLSLVQVVEAVRKLAFKVKPPPEPRNHPGRRTLTAYPPPQGCRRNRFKFPLLSHIVCSPGFVCNRVLISRYMWSEGPW